MKISFHLPYQTAWGETLHALLYRAGAAPKERKINIPLSTQDGKTWSGEIQLLLKQPAQLSYHYEVRRGPHTVRTEWRAVPRILSADPSASRYFLRDYWRDLPAYSWLYTSAATDVLLRRAPSARTPLKLFPRTLLLRAQTPVPPGSQLFVCGAGSELGHWNPDYALQMTEEEPNVWSLPLPVWAEYPREYKFILKTGNHVLWEQGPNRRLEAPPLKKGEVWVENDLRPYFGAMDFLRAAGTVLPVFSLRSEDGWGVGDFGDLEKLSDWAQQTGQHVLQLLPVNDTTLTRTWQDSYPYKAISIYALHPLFADVRRLPALDKKKEKSFEKRRRQLNQLPQIDYEQALQLKTERLQEAFKQEGQKVLSSSAFLHFYQENKHWLSPYAMFCVLRDRYHTSDFASWPKYTRFSQADLDAFCAPNAPDYPLVCFWYYVQYLLHTQLVQASQYARGKGVLLKGDIPIGVSPHSVEAWTEPSLFYLNAQAGAPPDDFSATGQNWGFPTYNWDVMARDGYRWWERRFTHMAQYFDAYRIDHVLGFFRIWEIPSHSVQGLLGQFSPALPLDTAEIENYGLTFNPDFLRPYISEQVLFEKLGDLAPDAKKKFLSPAPDGLYDLRPDYNTQRKIEAAFAGKTDEKSTRLKNGLYALVSNVLFVADRTDPAKYHPRIAALTDSAFRALNGRDKEAFTRLYNDYFYRRHNQFWKDEAMKKLPALTQATRMLACAEDLGMVPDCVPVVMTQLQMLSLEIQRMPKRLGETFADARTYPYLSVATPSTHDMSVLRGWWKENPALTQQFWNEVLQRPGQAPAEADAAACEQILRLHLQSPSMLALISWQDWSSMDETLRAPNPDEERINVPANPNHYWRYRMPISLEKLLKETAFNDKIRQMLAEAHR